MIDPGISEKKSLQEMRRSRRCLKPGSWKTEDFKHGGKGTWEVIKINVWGRVGSALFHFNVLIFDFISSGIESKSIKSNADQ